MGNTVLIYSGGLDSTSALYRYKDDIALAISFDYGSKHNKEEIKRAVINCEKLQIPHKVIDMSLAFKHINSALLDPDVDIPEGHYESESMKSTVVPFRNGIMLSIAAGIADSTDLKYVMIASHSGDHAIYPDCRVAFNHRMSDAMQLGTYNAVKLRAPFMAMDKKQVAQIGIAEGMNPTYTYSCYKGEAEQCGVCGTCLERRWALGEITQRELDASK